MDRVDKLNYRAAVEIHERLRQSSTLFHDVCLPEFAWDQCRRLLRYTVLARQRGWMLAAERCQRALRTAVQRLKNELAQLEPDLNSVTDLSPQPSLRELAGDLFALPSEFDDVTFDHQQKTVSVTTEPIELEGVFLGPFEIKLDWRDLAHGHSGNYRVIAVEPNPAASDSSVTHPHVQDEAVCEGDGRQPIRAALKQGRLFDFFTLVANLLRTYNPGSPFVSLDRWDGVECRDCGATTDRDDWYSCCQCGAVLCGDCDVRCVGCQDSHCLECLGTCARCDEYCCSYCLRACSECRDKVCGNCLKNNERCPKCHAKNTNEEETTKTNRRYTARSARTPVQPDGVGQTAVPAGCR